AWLEAVRSTRVDARSRRAGNGRRAIARAAAAADHGDRERWKRSGRLAVADRDDDVAERAGARGRPAQPSGGRAESRPGRAVLDGEAERVAIRIARSRRERIQRSDSRR